MEENKRILFTGGGTAGHVIVNLALIPYYQEEGWQIDYIGSYDGIEKRLIASLENVTYHGISTGKLRRYLSLENLKDPFKVLKGILQATRIISKTKPAVIFSKGGFVSVPVILAAKIKGVPVVIHESDYTPGLANKIAIPFAKKVLATFKETLNFLPENKRVYTSAVIREELFQGDRQAGLAFANLTGKKPVLLIMGGSAGSKKINDTVRECLDSLLVHYEIIHICGAGQMDLTYQQTGYAQFEYVDAALKDVFAASDLILSRAGSNAIFEFLALRKPMLLIPLSLEASRGDQIDNANSFAEKGYALVLEEEALSQSSLIEKLQLLETQAPTMRKKMEEFQATETRNQVIEVIASVRKQ